MARGTERHQAVEVEVRAALGALDDVVDLQPSADAAGLAAPLASGQHLRANFAPGLEGRRSPVLTMDGAVVGVVTAAVSEEEFARDTGALPQNLNWAVKIDYATPLFDVPRGVSASRDRPAATTPRDVVEQASQAVCIVLVAP